MATAVFPRQSEAPPPGRPENEDADPVGDGHSDAEYAATQPPPPRRPSPEPDLPVPPPNEPDDASPDPHRPAQVER